MDGWMDGWKGGRRTADDGRGGREVQQVRDRLVHGMDDGWETFQEGGIGVEGYYVLGYPQVVLMPA
jgi:hypothetical protein